MAEPSNTHNTAMVYVTAENADQARRISEALLEENLIACANIFPAVESLYRWEGKTVSESESVLILKTRGSLVERVTERIKELHSFTCPCVVAYASAGGNRDYLSWVWEETK